MKRFFFWLVMVCGGGALAWSVYAIEIGGLENVVQTIRNVVITSDGKIPDSRTSNVIMNINDPQGNDANKIFIKKGAFKNGTIAKEDIDWEGIFSGSNYFSCTHKGNNGKGYALQKIDYPNDATCVYVGDYRQPTDPQDEKGAIYYSGGVGIGMPGGVRKGDFRPMKKTFPTLPEDDNKVQFLIKDRLSPQGAIIVGKKDKYMAFSSDDGAAIVDVVNTVSGQKPQLVMGTDAGVSIGGDVIMSNAKLSVHGNVHADSTFAIHDPSKGSMQTLVSSDKTTIALTNKNFFIGGGGKDTNATKLSRRGPVARARSSSDTRLVVGSTRSATASSAPLTVHGGLSVRGQGEKGGIGIRGFVGVVDIKSAGCKVASVDNTGKVVMKAVAGCCVISGYSKRSCQHGNATRSISYVDGGGTSRSAGFCKLASTDRGSCSAGACGSATAKPTTTKPTTNLCKDGSTPTVSGQGPWRWTCAGTRGGSATTCSVAKKETPTYDIYTCQDNGTWSASKTNQTSIGSATQYGSGPYSPTSNVYVTAGSTKPSDDRCLTKWHYCGRSHTRTRLSYRPTTDLCKGGAQSSTPTFSGGDTTWNWTCARGNITSTCRLASMCGTAHDKPHSLTRAPSTAHLCAKGSEYRQRSIRRVQDVKFVWRCARDDVIARCRTKPKPQESQKTYERVETGYGACSTATEGRCTGRYETTTSGSCTGKLTPSVCVNYSTRYIPSTGFLGKATSETYASSIYESSNGCSNAGFFDYKETKCVDVVKRMTNKLSINGSVFVDGKRVSFDSVKSACNQKHGCKFMKSGSTWNSGDNIRSGSYTHTYSCASKEMVTPKTTSSCDPGDNIRNPSCSTSMQTPNLPSCNNFLESQCIGNCSWNSGTSTTYDCPSNISANLCGRPDGVYGTCNYIPAQKSTKTMQYKCVDSDGNDAPGQCDVGAKQKKTEDCGVSSHDPYEFSFSGNMIGSLDGCSTHNVSVDVVSKKDGQPHDFAIPTLNQGGIILSKTHLGHGVRRVSMYVSRNISKNSRSFGSFTQNNSGKTLALNAEQKACTLCSGSSSNPPDYCCRSCPQGERPIGSSGCTCSDLGLCSRQCIIDKGNR